MRLDIFFETRCVGDELGLRDDEPRFGRDILVIFFFTSDLFPAFALEEVLAFLSAGFFAAVAFLPEARFAGLVGSFVAGRSITTGAGSAGNSSV